MAKDKYNCCRKAEVIARTLFKTIHCGEGSWGILLECQSCGGLYLKDAVVSETRNPNEQERYDTSDKPYTGRLSRDALVSAVSSMQGGIDFSRL